MQRKDGFYEFLSRNRCAHFHNEKYELRAWCVMPNHVHALVLVQQTPLWKIVQGWKVHAANESRRLHLPERLAPSWQISESELNEPEWHSALRLKWQREYWDTFMRDEEQERKAIRYIENNPVKAKLCGAAEEWLFSSARFRNGYRRLMLPERKVTN